MTTSSVTILSSSLPRDVIELLGACKQLRVDSDCCVRIINKKSKEVFGWLEPLQSSELLVQVPHLSCRRNRRWSAVEELKSDAPWTVREVWQVPWCGALLVHPIAKAQLANAKNWQRVEPELWWPDKEHLIKESCLYLYVYRHSNLKEVLRVMVVRYSRSGYKRPRPASQKKKKKNDDSTTEEEEEEEEEEEQQLQEAAEEEEEDNEKLVRKRKVAQDEVEPEQTKKAKTATLVTIPAAVVPAVTIPTPPTDDADGLKTIASLYDRLTVLERTAMISNLDSLALIRLAARAAPGSVWAKDPLVKTLCIAAVKTHIPNADALDRRLRECLLPDNEFTVLNKVRTFAGGGSETIDGGPASNAFGLFCHNLSDIMTSEIALRWQRIAQVIEAFLFLAETVREAIFEWCRDPVPTTTHWGTLLQRRLIAAVPNAGVIDLNTYVVCYQLYMHFHGKLYQMQQTPLSLLDSFICHGQQTPPYWQAYLQQQQQKKQ